MRRHNVGPTDGSVRVLAGIGLIGLAARTQSRPLLALVLSAFGVLAVITGLTHSCPLYRWLGMTSHTTAGQS